MSAYKILPAVILGVTLAMALVGPGMSSVPAAGVHHDTSGEISMLGSAAELGSLWAPTGQEAMILAFGFPAPGNGEGSSGKSGHRAC